MYNFIFLEEYITKIEKLPVKFIIIVIIVMIIAMLFGLLYSNYKLMKKYTVNNWIIKNNNVESWKKNYWHLFLYNIL